MNDLLFVVFPYVAITLAVVVTIIRWRRHPFSVSALSSQLLEKRKLFWGSLSFHWGITIILLLHLAVLIIPSGFELWNGAPVRLYLLEATGIALALWAGVGLAILLYRRYTNLRVRAVTTRADAVVLGVIAVSIVTGLWIAIGYRWGSFWGTAVFVPYVRSLLIFQPRPELVEALPWVLKIHVLTAFVFVVAFPFTRLVHIITVPFGYLTRPWQKMIRMSRQPAAYHPASKKLLDRIR